ncbi:MAG TPA: SprT family zinc-dependent metalloprotease [Bacteroidales bacterium]|nr:SprT family zinc-dependent metalloprotease [Bacteroidales bacterium]
MNNPDPDTIVYSVIYSGRKSLGISIRRDSSIIIRVPYGTPERTILKLVNEKRSWILKHSAWFRDNLAKPVRSFKDGEKHLFRGKYLTLRINESSKQYCLFGDDIIDLGVRSAEKENIRKVLYTGYRIEAMKLFPGMMEDLVLLLRDKGLVPSGLKIKTMKSRWGSCSRSGIITLNSDLARLDDTYIKYVMIHELCHLKHHDHGKGFYLLLSEICPEWKRIKSEMRNFTAL